MEVIQRNFKSMNLRLEAEAEELEAWRIDE